MQSLCAVNITDMDELYSRLGGHGSSDLALHVGLASHMRASSDVEGRPRCGLQCVLAVTAKGSVLCSEYGCS